MTPDEARAAFDTARIARLATVAADGAPHLVPVTFAREDERLVTGIDAKPKRSRRLRRLENIAANPRVTLLVDEYDDDWARLWWARADGTARIIDGGPEMDHALALLRRRYRQYEAVELAGPAIVVEVERWSGWSASELVRGLPPG